MLTQVEPLPAAEKKEKEKTQGWTEEKGDRGALGEWRDQGTQGQHRTMQADST